MGTVDLHGYLAQFLISAAICLFIRPAMTRDRACAFTRGRRVQSAGRKVAHFPGLLPSHPIAFERIRRRGAIPAERMKAGRVHRVPLCDNA